jgi:hypothetical protein
MLSGLTSNKQQPVERAARTFVKSSISNGSFELAPNVLLAVLEGPGIDASEEAD